DRPTSRSLARQEISRWIAWLPPRSSDVTARLPAWRCSIRTRASSGVAPSGTMSSCWRSAGAATFSTAATCSAGTPARSLLVAYDGGSRAERRTGQNRGSMSIRAHRQPVRPTRYPVGAPVPLRLVVGQRTLNPLGEVRILEGQPHLPAEVVRPAMAESGGSRGD